MSLKFKAVSSYPFAVNANKTFSSFNFAKTSAAFSGVIIINLMSLKESTSGFGTIGAVGVTYSVFVTILAGGTIGFDEHAASDKIIINPSTSTVKRFSIFCSPLILCQWCARL